MLRSTRTDGQPPMHNFAPGAEKDTHTHLCNYQPRRRGDGGRIPRWCRPKGSEENRPEARTPACRPRRSLPPLDYRPFVRRRGRGWGREHDWVSLSQASAYLAHERTHALREKDTGKPPDSQQARRPGGLTLEHTRCPARPPQGRETLYA